MQSDLTNQVLMQVADRVVLTTRFTEEVVSQASGHTRIVQGAASRVFSPRFYTSREEGNGPLPHRLRNCGSKHNQMQALAAGRRAGASELAERMQQWALHHADDNSILTADAIWSTEAYGYDEDCGRCRGRGTVRCTSCGGDGRVTETVRTTRADGSRKTRRESRRCSRCFGKGYRTCTSCGGEGQLYYITYLRVEVLITESHRCLDPSERQEVQRELQLDSFSQLEALVQFNRDQTVYQNQQVVRTYNTCCPVTEVNLQIAEQPFEFIGFGPTARVLRYEDLASELLQQDKQRLGQALQVSGSIVLDRLDELRRATSHFLQSEVHADLRNPAHVESELLTADYAHEAHKMLTQALFKLYAQQMALPWLWIVAGFSLLMLLGSMQDFWLEVHPLYWYIGLLGMLLASMLAAEVLKGNRLRQRLEQQTGPSIPIWKLLLACWPLWVIRSTIIIVLCTLLIWLTAAYMPTA